LFIVVLARWRRQSTPETHVPRLPAARDYELAVQLAKLPGYALVGTREIAAISGFALNSVRQRKIPLPPAVYASRRKLLWRLQDVREWLANLSVAGRRRLPRVRLQHGEKSAGADSPAASRDAP
jgi:hypothetical protein